MMTAIQPYLDLILKERSWSWAIVCILYILAALFVRSWFVGPISVQMKMIERKHGHQLRKAYLKRALIGWVFFFFPIACVVVYWRKDAFPLPLKESWLLIASLSSFVISVLVHLQAFAIASLLTIESLENDKKRDA